MSGLYPYRDTRPSVDPTAFIAPGARIVGDVTLGAGTSVWFNAVIRADSASIVIGAGTNIQDCAVLHTDPGVPCEVGERCTIGHGAIVHACRIGRGSTTRRRRSAWWKTCCRRIAGPRTRSSV